MSTLQPNEKQYHEFSIEQFIVIGKFEVRNHNGKFYISSTETGEATQVDEPALEKCILNFFRENF